MISAHARVNVANRYASGKKAKLSGCKCIFDQIKANLTEIEPKNHQNVQETPFRQKAPGFNGLRVDQSFSASEERCCFVVVERRSNVYVDSRSLLLLLTNIGIMAAPVVL